MNSHLSRRRFVQASLAAPLLLSSLRFARAESAGIKISAFADEISPDLDEQIRVCKQLGITHIELRAAAGKNVLDFDAALRKTVREKILAGGLGVVSIGSPIGKVKLNEPWPAHFDRFKIAVELAEYFNAPMIRLFSYYPAKGKEFSAADRDEVIRRLQQQTDYVKDHPVTLAHENEKGIYGEKGPACLDILKTINSPKLRGVFDFANFVQAGDDTLKNWELLKPYITHFHIKDCKRDTKKVVPAGQGDGNLQPILEDAYKSGYRGFFSLEPHLKVAGHSSGETGADLFKVATNALREICRKGNIPLAS
ncbi:MAG: sugar phosphate isomerase/epimerase [Kiritimatiellaeota bacterium]|nr:sugar phosphate isomerase/epimerase [Kiritimatiellota bacterium]